jgi:hypothetical protein
MAGTTRVFDCACDRKLKRGVGGQRSKGRHLDIPDDGGIRQTGRYDEHCSRKSACERLLQSLTGITRRQIGFVVPDGNACRAKRPGEVLGMTTPV